jgi:hypothetical protein
MRRAAEETFSMDEAAQVAFLVARIGEQKMLRIERWRPEHDGGDKWPHAWRVGIEWYGEGQYEFISEKPHLIDALECAWEYLERHP